MPINPLNPITPSGQVDASEVRRISREAMRQSQVTAGGGVNVRSGGSGLIVTDDKPQKIWIRITAPGVLVSGAACYAWQAIAWIGAGAFVLLTGHTGSTTSLPAIEVNDDTTVDDGYIVEATISPKEDALLFTGGNPDCCPGYFGDDGTGCCDFFGAPPPGCGCDDPPPGSANVLCTTICNFAIPNNGAVIPVQITIHIYKDQSPETYKYFLAHPELTIPCPPGGGGLQFHTIWMDGDHFKQPWMAPCPQAGLPTQGGSGGWQDTSAGWPPPKPGGSPLPFPPGWVNKPPLGGPWSIKPLPPILSAPPGTGPFGDQPFGGPAFGASGRIDATVYAATGVTAGSYTNATITVGADGKLTAASSGTDWPTLGTVTGSDLAADQNDYAPGACVRLRVRTNGGGVRSITGLSIGQTDGQLIVIENYGSINAINLVMGSGSSSAGNRFNNGASVSDDVIATQTTVMYQYSSTTSEWRKIN